MTTDTPTIFVNESYDRYEQSERFCVRVGFGGGGFQITPQHFTDARAVAHSAAQMLRDGVEFATVSNWLKSQEC